MSNIAKNIVRLLEEHCMTQKEIADAIGVTEATISRYVNGYRVPKLEHAVAMSKVLNCSVEEICKENE